MNINDSTPVAMLTIGQLKEALMPLMVNAPIQNTERRYEYGLRGFAKVFGCSVPTAQRMKRSGKFDAAIKQSGRKIVIDADMALELAGKVNNVNR